MTLDIRRLVIPAVFIMACFYSSPSWSQISDEINRANGFYQTNQYQKAADIYEVSRLLGHSSVIVTERHYLDILDENFHRAVRSLDSNNPPSSTP